MKPLDFVFQLFPNEYSAKNTVIIDDLIDVKNSNGINCIHIYPFDLFIKNTTIFNDECLVDNALLYLPYQINERMYLLKN